MSLSSFSLTTGDSSPRTKKFEMPYHEKIQIQELPTAKDMSHEYVKKRKQEEEERMAVPKNSPREEDPLQSSTQTVLAVANLFPASEHEKILQQSDQILRLQTA